MYSPTRPEIPGELTFHSLLSQAGGDIQVTLHLGSQLWKSALGKPYRTTQTSGEQIRAVSCTMFTPQRSRQEGAGAQTHRAKESKGKEASENMMGLRPSPYPRGVNERMIGFLTTILPTPRKILPLTIAALPTVPKFTPVWILEWSPRAWRLLGFL